MDTECTRSILTTFGNGIIIGGFVLASLFLILQVVDWWKYAPYPQKVKCRRYGHDYHNGDAKNIVLGEYTYDFCQRCHTEQNRQKVKLIDPQP